MKKISNTFFAIVIAFLIIRNDSFAQIRAGENVELQIERLTASHQLKFPTLTKKVYADKKNQLIWFNPDHNLVWKAHELLFNSGQYGLKPDNFHCDQITAGLINNLLAIKGANAYKTSADILITDAMINFINQLHYGMANPSFPLKSLDKLPPMRSMAINVLKKSIESKEFDREILNVQPIFKGYKQLQQFLKLMVGQYTGDCYEISEETEKLIVLNLERWRWINSMETSYLLINIPAYELQFFKNDYEVHNFRTIVGQANSPTPLLSSNIRTVKVPSLQKVAISRAKEILRRAAEEPTYLQANQFLICDTQGKVIEPTSENLRLVQTDIAKYTVVQVLWKYNTPDNIVLFIEGQNRLHIRGTSEKKIFEKTDRAVSKGDIVVEDIDALLKSLMTRNNLPPDNQYFEPMVLNYKTKEISLPKTLSIYIVYLTCDVRDGILTGYNDVYHLDEKLIKKMKLR
ncbi:MAG TPA: hypothetical protein VL125_08400 [Pelobium sp.]|nr:hypothetical protein [Pelobium sp.]